MIKLALVIPLYESFRAFLMPLAEELANRGYRLLVICSNPPSEVEASSAGLVEGIKFRSAPLPRGFSPLGYLRAMVALRRIILEESPYLIHAHFSAAALACALAKKRNWPPFLVTFQGLAFSNSSIGLKRLFILLAELYTIGRSDKSWVLTQDDRDAVKSLFPQAKLFVQKSLGFGCELNRFEPKAIKQDQLTHLATELRINKDNFIFIFMGRWTAFKGFALVVRAFQSIQNRHPHAKLLLVGGYDQLHQSGLTSLEQEKLFYNPGIIPAGWREDTAPFLALSDVFVLPSEREGMPVCIMEAMSMGLPVITANSRGCRDLVEDETSGILVDCSQDMVTSAMLRIIENNELRLRLGKSALANRERFDRLSYIQEQVSIYQEFAITSP